MFEENRKWNIINEEPILRAPCPVRDQLTNEVRLARHASGSGGA